MTTPRTSRRREQLQQLFSLLVAATDAKDSKLGIEGIEMLSTAAGSIPEMQLRAWQTFDRLKRNDMADQLSSIEFVMLFDCDIPDSVAALDTIIQRICASKHPPVVPSSRAASTSSRIPRISRASPAREPLCIEAEEVRAVPKANELHEKRDSSSSSRPTGRPSLVPRLNLAAVNAPDQVESKLTVAPVAAAKTPTSQDRVAKLKQMFLELDLKREGRVQSTQILKMSKAARSAGHKGAKKALDSLLQRSDPSFESEISQSQFESHLSGALGDMEDTEFEELIQQLIEMAKKC